MWRRRLLTTFSMFIRKLSVQGVDDL
jgi:hypothetical protein